MADTIHFKVDGKQIKSARKAGGRHCPVLRMFLPGQAEQRVWGGTITGGRLRVYRSRIEDEFQIILLGGHFRPGCPEPVVTEARPWKHVYIQQSLLHKHLDALVACCNRSSWYHHDVTIVGNSEIAYDRKSRGFRGNVQLWIQTKGQIIREGNTPWQSPVQREKAVSPDILSECDTDGRAVS